MDDPQDKRNANKVLNRLMTNLSATHGETANGGTRLDKDLAEMQSDYTTYADVIKGNSTGYWLSEANLKDKNGKTVPKSTINASDILIVNSPAKGLATAIKNSKKSYKMLSAETGIPESSIEKYAKGQNKDIPESDLSKLAKATGSTVDKIRGDYLNDAKNTVSNLAKYYEYVDTVLNTAWDDYAKTDDYKSATNAEKYARFIELRNAACYAALKKIESENK